MFNIWKCTKPMIGESEFVDFNNKDTKSINLSETDIRKNLLKDYNVNIINNDFEMIKVID